MFHAAELFQKRITDEAVNGVFHNVAQFPFRENEEIAGIYVTVVFDDRVRTAGFRPTARHMNTVNEVDQNVFQESN